MGHFCTLTHCTHLWFYISNFSTRFFHSFSPFLAVFDIMLSLRSLSDVSHIYEAFRSIIMIVLCSSSCFFLSHFVYTISIRYLHVLLRISLLSVIYFLCVRMPPKNNKNCLYILPLSRVCTHKVAILSLASEWVKSSPDLAIRPHIIYFITNFILCTKHTQFVFSLSSLSHSLFFFPFFAFF